MITEHSDKLDIARILIERVDGAVAKARVSTIALANAVLERWARDVPDKCEAECEIHVIFEDGLHCMSRMNLKQTQKRISLSRHLRQQLAAITAPENNGHAKQSGHATIMGVRQPTLFPGLEAMLTRYDI